MKSTTFTICFTILATVFLAHLLATPGSQAVAASVNAEASVTVQNLDDDTELGKKLKEKLEQLLETLKDSIDHGKTVKEDLTEKLKETRQQLRDMEVDMGQKAKELLEKNKEKAKDFWQRILDRLRPSEK